MRKISSVAIAMIMGVALYFTMFWGYDGLRVLASPTYGLDDVWLSQYVFGIGRVFGLGPVGLMQLAAFFGTLKLAVAGICIVHIFERFRSVAGGKPVSELLEGGLILAALIAIVSAAPAVWSHNADVVREQVIQLALAGITIALCMVERRYRRANEDGAAVTSPPAGIAFTPWR